MLNAFSFADDPITNLQLGLAIELAVLPPYLYALWSIKPQAAGASSAALEAASTIRAVVYEEMLHASLAANVLNSLNATPKVTQGLITYPGPLPGHVKTGPFAYDVGLWALSASCIAVFLKIERPEWGLLSAQSVATAADWITIGAFYEGVKAQLAALPGSSFGHGKQLARSDNPGPGQMVDVVDLGTACAAIQTIVDQGEGHKPDGDPAAEDDDDHEVAHFYQFKVIESYFLGGLIDPVRDLYPVIDNPDPARYSAAQRAANDRFNDLYTLLLDSLQATLGAGRPSVFGPPTQLMVQLRQAAAVLRNAGNVPGTDFVAGPTFQYLGAREQRTR